MQRQASSAMRPWHTSMAGVSRVSPVSCRASCRQSELIINGPLQADCRDLAVFGGVAMVRRYMQAHALPSTADSSCIMHCDDLPGPESSKDTSVASYIAHMEKTLSGHLLKCKAKDGDLLSRDCVEHARDDALHKSVFLIVIYLDHRVPILRNPLQADALAAHSQKNSSYLALSWISLLGTLLHATHH